MSTDALSRAELVVRTIAQTAVDNETYFCELDAVAGDGDFGYSLARGFEVVLSDWDSMEYGDVSGLLKKTAIVLTKKIGGTTGPIWGTAFLRTGGALGDIPEPNGEQLIAAMRAGIEGIKQRGNADLGDKTLLDALVPFTDRLEQELENGASSTDALRAAATTARPNRLKSPAQKRTMSGCTAGWKRKSMKLPTESFGCPRGSPTSANTASRSTSSC